MPDGAPRGLQIEAAPGTFCYDRRMTSYLFNRELIKKINIQLQIFTWVSFTYQLSRTIDINLED